MASLHNGNHLIVATLITDVLLELVLICTAALMGENTPPCSCIRLIKKVLKQAGVVHNHINHSTHN